jgi:hypothetical protein
MSPFKFATPHENSGEHPGTVVSRMACPRGGEAGLHLKRQQSGRATSTLELIFKEGRPSGAETA